MSTQDIHTQIDSLDGKNVDYSDPNLYAQILGYDQDAGDEGQGGSQSADSLIETSQGDAAAAAATTVDGTAAAGQPDNTSQAAAAPAAATSDSTAVVTDQQGADQSQQGIDGVATRDGKRIIPYAVLEHERREKQQLKDQLKDLQQQLQAKAAGASTEAGDLADRAATNPDSLTDAELQELEKDFPSLAKPMKVLRALTQKVEGLQQGSQAPAAAQPTQQAAQAPVQPEDEQAAFDNGIADNPLLAKWMSEGGREWQRAVAIDRVLSADPENANLTYSQRFAKVQAMVAAEFGIQAPAAPKPAPAGGAKPASAAAAAPAQPQTQQVMPTLTDLGGMGVSVSKDPLDGMTPGQMVDAAMDMSEEQLRRMAGLSY